MTPLSASLFGVMLVGIISGFASIILVVYSTDHGAARIARWWSRSPRLGKDRAFRRRIAWALSPHKLTMALPLLVPLLFPWYLLALLGESFAWFVLGHYASYALGILLLYPLFLRKFLGHFRQELAMHAVRKLAKIGDNAFAEALLVKAAQSSEPLMRIVATEGLQNLGTPAGNAALDKLCGDRQTQVSLAACAAAGRLYRVLSGKHVMPLEPLEKLLREFDLWSEKQRKNPRHEPEETRTKIAQIEREIEQILHSQFILRRAFPDLYCKRCHDFAEQKAHADWRWVRCKVCHEAKDLRAGISQVVGQIGGAQPWEIDGQVLRVSLWDATSRSLIPGVVHSLEVIGGRDLDYDWALSAVMEMLRNRSQFVPIQLIDAPALSANSGHLLKDYLAERR